MISKIIVFFFAVNFFSFSATAEDVSIKADAVSGLLNLPLGDKQKVNGYKPFPVVQCPSVKSKYNEMISKLSEVKDRLKKEACATERAEVESFEKVLGADRKSFIELVNKGVKEELKDEEIESIKSYIDRVVKKTAKISGLLNNSACFDEDAEAKQSVLGLLASAIDGSASVLGMLSGPWGMKIKLGGKFAAGLLSSIDAVVRENRSYDFGSYGTWGFGAYSERNYKKTVIQGYKDRINYVTSLCAYYQLKEDLDEISDPDGAEERYYRFKQAAEAQLKRYEEDCDDCAKIIQDYNNQRANKLSFSIEGFSEPLTYKKMNWKHLEKFYEPLVKSADDAFETPSGLKGPGHKTIRSLTTLVWSEMQMERIWEERGEDSMDQARDAVPYLQRQIESFLVDQEGPRFVKNRYDATNYLYGYLRNYIREKHNQLESLLNTGTRGVIKYMPESETPVEDNDKIVKMVHRIYSDDIDFASIITNESYSRDAKLFRKRIKRGVRQALEDAFRAYSAGTKFCRFFSAGAFGAGDSNSIATQCRIGKARSQALLEFVKSLEETAMAVPHSRSLARFSAKEETVAHGKKVELQYTANWMESLTSYIQWRVADPDMLKPRAVVNSELESEFNQD